MLPRVYERLADPAEGTAMNPELSRVRQEAQGMYVKVDGWQEGTENVHGFASVTDKATRTTFAVKSGVPLADALRKVRARMAEGRRTRKTLDM